jgi:hypothetical protein
MTSDRSRLWQATIGLAASVTILAMLSIAIIWMTTGHQAYQGAPFQWPTTIMHLLFGQSR